MTAIALQIIGYWVAMGLGMWTLMCLALILARACEFIADRLLH